MNNAKLNLEQIEYAPFATEILEKAKKTFGFAPNMYLKMGANAALLDAYTYSYNSFRSNSGFTPVEQEVIFLTVARANGCEYCMAAHSFVADAMSKVPVEVTEAIRYDLPIPDAKLAALSKLTHLLTENRGWGSQAAVDEFLAEGYSESHVLGAIAGIGIKTLSNYANHLTQPMVDAAFSSRTWKKERA